jgi:uncharacterized repeat protein (TIGR01451 family)
MSLSDLEKKLYDNNSESSEEHNNQKNAHIEEKNPINNSLPPQTQTQSQEFTINKYQNLNFDTQESSSNALLNTILKISQAGKWLFWFLIIVTILAIGSSAFYIIQYLKGSDVNLALQGPNNILIGVPFELNAQFINNSNKPLKNVEFSIILPEGTMLAQNLDNNKRVFNYNAGDLEQGATAETKIKVIAIKNSESIRKFTFVVSYYLASLGDTAKLSKETYWEVRVQEPAITLNLNAPQKILNNEIFEIKLEYKNIANIDLQNAEISIALPNNLTVQNIIPTPLTANTWHFSNISKGAGGTITIQGKIQGANSSFFEIKSIAKVSGSIINEKSANIYITPAPLSLNIKLNDQDDYIASPDETLKYTIYYKNNSDTNFNNVVIKVNLSGEMFDYSRLQTNGFFDSKNKTITWNVANTPSLQLIAPNGEGSVSFDISTKTNYPIKRLTDKNFVLKLEAEISSPTVPYYVSADKTLTLTTFTTKIRGQANIAAKLFFKDPNNGFENYGPLPLKVNNPTTLNVHWLITNYGTDIENINIKAFTMGGVRLTGKIKSNVASLPIYNQATGEITWTIDKILATKGIISQPIEAIFQIEVIPNIIQINQPMPLISETKLTAQDSFTGSQITYSLPALTSQNINDLNFEVTKSIIQP